MLISIAVAVQKTLPCPHGIFSPVAVLEAALRQTSQTRCCGLFWTDCKSSEWWPQAFTFQDVQRNLCIWHSLKEIPPVFYHFLPPIYYRITYLFVQRPPTRSVVVSCLASSVSLQLELFQELRRLDLKLQLFTGGTTLMVFEEELHTFKPQICSAIPA